MRPRPEALKRRQCLANQANGAHQIELIGDIPVAIAGLFERRRWRTASVGDQAIETAQYGDGLGNDARDLRWSRHVGGGIAGCTQLCRRSLELFGVAGTNEYAGAFLGQCFGAGEAKASAGARHKRPAVL